MGYIVLPQVNANTAWQINGNNSLTPGSYIGSNDPLINEFIIRLNNDNVFYASISPYVNVLIGLLAGLNSNLQTSVAIGAAAGQNATGNGNLSLGTNSGSNIQGNFNSFLGENSGINSIGDNNIFLGSNSGENSNAQNTIGIGTESLKNNTANAVVAIGDSSGINNGYANCFIVNTSYLPNFPNHGAAAAAINIGTGASSGNTYLYRHTGNDTIGFVTIP